MTHPLQINIRQYKGKPVHLDIEAHSKNLDINTSDFKFDELIQIEASFEIISKKILFKCLIKTNYQTECHRCLDTIEGDLKIENILLDFEDIGQDIIDLTNDIRDEILLSLPTKVLCTLNCKGFCINCKKNLNKENCICDPKEENNIFSKVL